MHERLGTPGKKAMKLLISAFFPMIRLLHKLFISCILIGLTISTVSAEESDSTDTTITASTPRPIEEITVVGQQSLACLRLCIDEKEAEIYNFLIIFAYLCI